MFVESRKVEAATSKRQLGVEMRRFAATDEGWYNGTPASVDGRLAQARRVLVAAQGVLQRNPYDWDAHDIVTRVTADRQALENLKDDLLTAAADRKAPGRAHSDTLLTSSEKRWVVLEVPKFIRANQDCLTDPQGHEELATRAANHAALVTSTSPRSRELTASFVETVAYEARQIRLPSPQRTASRDVREIDGAALFL